MSERDLSEAAVGFRIPTTQEVIDAYLALSEEEKVPIHERAARLRHGPTGMDDAEAIFSVMAEKLRETESNR